jgi:hypothetical protein
MAKHNFTPASAATDPRLATLRGSAPQRSPSVRVLAAYAQHTDCTLATLGFAAGVDLDRLLRGTPYQPALGQSPFAFARGLQFEEQLRRNGYEPIIRLLEAEGGVTLPAPRVVNLRTKEPMAERSNKTLALLAQIIRHDPTAPHLLDGAILRGDIGGVLAHFEADAVAACLGEQFRVAEVKSFPRVDERIDPDKLGSALDQVAVYILLARREIDRLGGDGDRLVSDLALLITPRNVGLTPTLSVQSVGQRVSRVERLLAAVPRAADVAASVPTGLSFGPISDARQPAERRVTLLHDLADRVGTAYRPGCLTTCGNAFFCRERAFQAGSPCLVGSAATRLLPGVDSLGRAAQLSRGATPQPEEAPAAALLDGAGQLYDELTAGSPTQRRRA